MKPANKNSPSEPRHPAFCVYFPIPCSLLRLVIAVPLLGILAYCMGFSGWWALAISVAGFVLLQVAYFLAILFLSRSDQETP